MRMSLIVQVAACNNHQVKHTLLIIYGNALYKSSKGASKRGKLHTVLQTKMEVRRREQDYSTALKMIVKRAS